ncbi:MAG: hypothetical protein QF723_06385, partial [Phycisphaerales bacterium]|nr:hypothetical protein [Phycisphaerales bacterium]
LLDEARGALVSRGGGGGGGSDGGAEGEVVVPVDVSGFAALDLDGDGVVAEPDLSLLLGGGGACR